MRNAKHSTSFGRVGLNQSGLMENSRQISLCRVFIGFGSYLDLAMDLVQ